MQGGKKKDTKKEKNSSRSKALVEYRQGKVEGKEHLLTGCNAIFPLIYRKMERPSKSAHHIPK